MDLKGVLPDILYSKAEYISEANDYILQEYKTFGQYLLEKGLKENTIKKIKGDK